MNKSTFVALLALCCAPAALAAPAQPAATPAAAAPVAPEKKPAAPAKAPAVTGAAKTPSATTGSKATSVAGKAAQAPAAKTTQSKGKKLSAAEAAIIEKFIHLQDAAIATFLELGDTLEGVKDRDSADEAAPTVKMAGEQLCTIIAAVEALGDPSEAAQQAIMSRVANVAEKKRIEEQVMEPMLTLMMQEPPCHGSNALYDALDALLANLQGAAGLDDDEVEEHADAAMLQEPDSDESAAQP